MKDLPSAATMIRAAEDATGLCDWGGDLFRAPFDVLVGDLHDTAQLTPLGAARAHRRLSDSLVTRLRLAADRKANPGIAREKIERPIFVTGLPRAGTTFFHSMLTADAVNRSPITWEIMFPSPPPEDATFDTDARIAQAQDAMAFEGFLQPELLAIHPFAAARPEECNFIWEHSFLSVNFAAWWNVPNYSKLLYSTDFTAVYEEQYRFLQHLQSRRRRDRWVLKTPAHIAWLEALLAVFPDARFVQCHRDPARIVPSLANNLTVWRRTFSDQVTPGHFGMLDLQAAGLQKAAAIRRRGDLQGRFFDAHYVDVQADPLGVLAACYRQFGVPFSTERQDAVRAWIDADRADHARGPKHVYALEDYGIDLAEIDRVYAPYFADFGVAKERAGWAH